MNYINELENLNISFKSIDKVTANKIIETEFPLFKLLEYGSLFDTYIGTDKKGKFINLDFEQLYSIAKIDEEFSNIVLCQYLEIERTLKALILKLYFRNIIPKNIVEKYIETDEEYLISVYRLGKKQILSKYPNLQLKELTIEQFLDVIQAGTFERFYSYIYKNYLFLKEDNYENYIISAIRLRNIVAHNEGLLSQLDKKCEYGSNKLVSILGQKGINHKTLKTNMSKKIIFDYCNMLLLYNLIEPKYKKIQNFTRMETFLLQFCKPYINILSSNNILASSYSFLISVIEILKKF